MMKKIFIFCLFVTMFFGQTKNVKQLEWIDPHGRQPLTYSMWYSTCREQPKPTRISAVTSKTSGHRQNVVNIIVNARIYPELVSELTVFMQDLINAGYSVQLDTISGMSHTVLRNHLSSITNLHGAIFVGEIPIAWFETNGFGGWEEFPHDVMASMTTILVMLRQKYGLADSMHATLRGMVKYVCLKIISTRIICIGPIV
jgi:hypothetical protein